MSPARTGRAARACAERVPARNDSAERSRAFFHFSPTRTARNLRPSGRASGRCTQAPREAWSWLRRYEQILVGDRLRADESLVERDGEPAVPFVEVAAQDDRVHDREELRARIIRLLDGDV